MRAQDGKPIALGYHTGHWEISLLVQAAAQELRQLGAIPFAGYCSDPCDGRTQGTPGMFDSLPYRNDAAYIFRRLIRSLPQRAGVLGVATCDKGLPAMMMALAAMKDLPCVLVPGGVALPPSALAPSGQPVRIDLAVRSARAVCELEAQRRTMKEILSTASIRNAMAVHAAVGGSTNLLLHIPAIAHSAGLPRPTIEEWIAVNRQVPRIVDVLPNGPTHHPTRRVFLARGVPEIMLHLRPLRPAGTRVI